MTWNKQLLVNYKKFEVPERLAWEIKLYFRIGLGDSKNFNVRMIVSQCSRQPIVNNSENSPVKCVLP